MDRHSHRRRHHRSDFADQRLTELARAPNKRFNINTTRLAKILATGNSRASPTSEQTKTARAPPNVASKQHELHQALVRQAPVAPTFGATGACRTKFRATGTCRTNLCQRFFPSEFGNDVDRVHAVELARTSFATKAKIRRAVEAERIPYTYVASNFFAGLYLSSFSQPGAAAPPRDKVVIVAFFNKEDDIGINSIKAVDDPRTLNKILYIRPRCSIYSFNDLVSLWEEKIGKALDRVYVTEEQLLKNIQEASYPLNMLLPIGHSAYVLGDQTNFEIEPSFGVEATELYPDANYTTVDEYLNQFI
ncbi:Phenylcoumaran benzylic ether reductase 1 [Citrus sinensis]|uniref:Phenylcoumaran benzylic ether reductase 1 n=1 Tax=Citrus sinensis TaxID=2711 RepID=A0ACB8IGS6_CITSI|nr:Phenylcoumaran benzylic ether reductase 1 [Citrus sinensis]